MPHSEKKKEDVFIIIMYVDSFLQMEIDLRDQVVVLDEAHNVEDSARDAASLTLTAVDLQNALDDLDKLGNNNKL